MTLRELKEKLNEIEDDERLDSEVTAVRRNGDYLEEYEIEQFNSSAIHRQHFYKVNNCFILKSSS